MQPPVLQWLLVVLLNLLLLVVQALLMQPPEDLEYLVDLEGLWLL